MECRGCQGTESGAGRDIFPVDLVNLAGCSKAISIKTLLCPEFEWASVDDGSENIAGCQHANQLTGAIEDRNRPDLFIERDMSNLSDLCRRSCGQGTAAHDAGKLVPADDLGKSTDSNSCA